MTRFIYDQFSKDYLDELLFPYGEVNASRSIASEIQEIDLCFSPSIKNLPNEPLRDASHLQNKKEKLGSPHTIIKGERY